MGKIAKKASEKHKLALSPAVSDFVDKLTNAPLSELPSLFAEWSQRWPIPRGELYNWIEPLDRFDKILEDFNIRYGLNDGPQHIPFGVSLLLDGSSGADEKSLKQFGFGPEGDRELVESILVFSRLLVEKSANRTIYNSTDRLNSLLNTTSLSLLHSTLRLTIFLAQRYLERSPPHSQPGKFYSFDPTRLQILASPFFGPHGSVLKRPPTSPVKTKSRDKSSQTPGRPRRGSSAANPNDFRSLSRDVSVQATTGKSASTTERDWTSWVHVRVAWSPSEDDQAQNLGSTASYHPTTEPSTPTPLRQPGSPLLSRTTTSESATNQLAPKTKRTDVGQAPSKHLEFSSADLAETSIENLLRSHCKEMPAQTQYEFLHKLRVAYGLTSSSKSRRDLLSIRLLALNTLANISADAELSTFLFASGHTTTQHQELIHQIVSLLQDARKGQGPVSLYLQTLAMETLGVLARHKVFAADIVSALGANTTHGLLLRLTQKGLADIAKDADNTDTLVGDDWREAIFSMPRVVIEASGHHGRSSETFISTQYLTAYVSGLSIVTGKSLRVHLRMLDFIKTFFHHFKDGLATLLATNAFEAVVNLMSTLTNTAWQQLQDGHGFPGYYKTQATDYDIPYIHQQIIRSIVDMINDISGHQGANADRVLRNLIDSHTLLGSFRLILDHLRAFGPFTWSEVVKSVCGFLHNEPTSYTLISEAGIIRSLLDIVVPAKTRPTPTPDTKTQPIQISSKPQDLPPGIPPVWDAIASISQVFGAICLTNSGFDLFRESGALEKFFEIFESPAHVRVLKDANALALLGSTFDELVRHFPSLKDAVLSAVTVMLAKVHHRCVALAKNPGAGPKLWLPSSTKERTVCGGNEALQVDIIPGPRLDDAGRPIDREPLQLPSGDFLLFESCEAEKASDLTLEDADSHGLTAVDYARPAISFLMNFFENPSLCNSFMELGGSDIVLEFITLPSQPIDGPAFVGGGLFNELPAVVHMMAETKPHLVIPVLANRMQYACQELKHFSQCQPSDSRCYFNPLVKPDSEHTDAQSEVERNGTRIAKSLMAVYSLATVAAEVFGMAIYTSRSASNVLFSQVNLADLFADICQMMGGISAACYREEIALQRAISSQWLAETRPEITTGVDEVDAILSLRDSGNSNKKNPPSAGTIDQDTTLETATLETDRQTAPFKNVVLLRLLLIETPYAINQFMTRLGRGLAGRRRMDSFTRQKSAAAARALASAYIAQLQPYFLQKFGSVDVSDEKLDFQFAYLVVALSNFRQLITDDSHTAIGESTRQSFVLDAFRKAGGVKALTDIGSEFFDQLKSCKVANYMILANTGLKICLEILDDITNSKLIMDSAQSSNLRNPEPNRPVMFVPGQALLELRMEALVLARRIWSSEYTDQASRDVVKRLISILGHVLTADQEGDAFQTDAAFPEMSTTTLRKYIIDEHKLTSLKDKGYAEDLAREALYRCNSHNAAGLVAAQEYCKAVLANPARQRLPVPGNDTDVPATTRDTPNVSSPPAHGLTVGSLIASNLTGTVEAALAEIVNNGGGDDEMPDILDIVSADTSAAASVLSSQTINGRAETSLDINSSTVAVERSPPPRYSVQSINVQREELREDLADRCINILNNHQDLTFELSELINSAAKNVSDDVARQFWEVTSALLINSLLSMQSDEDMSESGGKKVAAAAHLTALLIQDADVFKKSFGVFQDTLKELLAFVKIPVSSDNEASYPWVAPILLIVERILSRDSEPAEIEWKQPHDVDSFSPPILTKVELFNNDTIRQLFDLLVAVLPRVGKDKTLGLSIARVLVILTRRRELASVLAERANLQRLFLMIKQLSVDIGSKLQSALMIILRHIVEDEDTLKQIMRSEITAYFSGRSSSRSHDMTSYVRDMYHMVTRSSEIFIEVTNDMVKLASFQAHAASPLALKEAPEQESSTTGKPDTLNPTGTDTVIEPAASIETEQGEVSSPTVTKSIDAKAPSVDRPDGVLHFILSELLAYKDVEDKEPAVDSSKAVQPSHGQPSNPAATNAQTGIATDSGAREAPVPPKPEKPKFKAEEHPIFIYRCFLLQCLSELLHSYNRTKIEFINFSRKADPMAITPSKPRAGILNYLLHSLVPSTYVDRDDSLRFKKRMMLSDCAIRVIVALCSKTGETGISAPTQRYSSQPHVDDQDTESDLAFVRRFALDHAIRAFKEATSSTEAIQIKYSRILCLTDMFNRLLSKPAGPDGTAGSQNTSYKVLGRMMFERDLISVLTGSLAEIDLSYPGSKRVVKFILRPLQELTSTAVQLSLTSTEKILSVIGNVADETISSASSVSDVEDEREETPDLFRNSALGMLDPNRAPDYESESEEDEEDEEMYDQEYDDAMDYEEDMPTGPNDGEAVSDDEVLTSMPPDVPIGGSPGDVPMDIEFVVEDPHMDVDSDENDDDEDEDSDEGDDEDEDDEEDEDDDDDENEDFMIEDEIEEMVGGGSGGSLDDGQDEDDVWEDEDGEGGEDEDEDSELDPESTGLGRFLGPAANAEHGLNNLLRVLGEQNLDEPVLVHAPPGVAITTGEILNPVDDEDDDEEGLDNEIEEDEEEDGEGMEDDEDDMDDERGNARYGGFHPQIDPGEEALQEGDVWGWGEPPTFVRRHRHNRISGGQMPGFFHRRMIGEPMHASNGGRLGRHLQQGRSGVDDGMNPLLQRPNSETPRPNRPAVTTHSIVLPDVLQGLNGQLAAPPTFQAVVRGGEQGLVGHGAMLDAILQAIHRGDHNFLQNGRIQLNMTASMPEIHHVLGQNVTNSIHRHPQRPSSHHVAHFHPATTMTRWQEETRLLYGNTHLEKVQRIQQLLMSMLIPPAQAEEKIRRRKKEEEDQKAKEEAERKRAEEEKLRKEVEERESTARAEEEAKRHAEAEAEAQVQAAASAIQSNDEVVDTNDQPMEGVQTGGGEDSAANNAAESSNDPDTNTERVFVTIRGRQLDITGLDIDLNYLNELPEEFREEVIMTQYAQRRDQAQEQGGDTSVIDPEFLNALPEEIREELRLQEAQTQRRREREAARRQAAAAGGAAQAEEMDNDNFLATLDPALRRAILAEQPPEILQQLDPRHAAEARVQARRLFHFSGLPAERAAQVDQLAQESTQRDSKRQVVQLIEKAGVATLLRLMFIPQHGSLRSNLWQILRNVCGNRQTRYEVVNLLLTILKEGSTDVAAVEKSLASLSLKAKASGIPKTPQSLKRTLSIQTHVGVSEEVTPILVVQQCLSALKQLSSVGFHVKTIFLRDVDGLSTTTPKKGKDTEQKSHHYPINDLVSLLDRKLIMESSTCLQSLAELLASVTSPLPLMMRKDKKEDDEKTPADQLPATEASTAEAQQISESQRNATESSNSNNDTVMIEAGQATNSGEIGATSLEPTERSSTEIAVVPTEGSNDEDVSIDEAKAKKTTTPPEISDLNLRLLVKIFTAQECSSETFRFTLETLSNLSFIPFTDTVFSGELVDHVKNLSGAVCNDLDEFLPQIREAQSSSDVQPISSTKFTPTGSDQVKLLRVLQALDYLSSPKKDGEKSITDNNVATSDKITLAGSYETLSLGPIWRKLGECLKAIKEKDNVMSFASILLPLIESLMVVCKNTSLKDSLALKDTLTLKESQDLTASIESLDGGTDLEKLFFTFTTEHRQILNDIIRQNPKLMQGNGSFSLLVKNPKVLDFDNKRSYFTKQIHSRHHTHRHIQPPLQLNVRREQVFQDSYKALYFKSADEMKYGKLNIRFNGEEGVDAGGVTREWFQVLARGMFNPDWALWQPVAADRTTFHPNPLSWINNEHLLYFKFIGRIIGKALHEGRVLDCHFSRAVYKRLLGKQPNLKDLESMDLDYYKSLVWILENDIGDVLTEDFSVIEEQFGEEKIIDLIENGRNIPVTEQNKREYVQKLVEYRLTTSVKSQLDEFIKGFHDIIPAELIAIFDEQELELLISGLPEIDVDDWKANTEYHNYTANSPQITWFWRVVRAMSHEDRAKLLQFVTGTSKVPLEGFKGLEGMQGITKMSIHADPSKDRLPTSHTCFNQLDLPQYDNLDLLKANLMKAINLGADYFGFA